MTEQFQYTVPLTIDQDWTKIRSTYNNFLNAISKIGDGKGAVVDEWQVRQYNIGNQGALIKLDKITDGEWFMLSGQVLDKLLPWHDLAFDLFSDCNLKHMSFSKMNKPIIPHVDNYTKEMEEQGIVKCNLNYTVTCTDPDARLVSTDMEGNNREETRLIPGTAVLLDSNMPHSVEINGEREMFQFQFFASFETVKKRLKEIGSINLCQR